MSFSLGRAWPSEGADQSSRPFLLLFLPGSFCYQPSWVIMSLIQTQRSVQCHLFSWVNSDCSDVLWGSDHLMLPLESHFLLCFPFCKATGAGDSPESSRGWGGGQGPSGFSACPRRPCTPFPALAGGLLGVPWKGKEQILVLVTVTPC